MTELLFVYNAKSNSDFKMGHTLVLYNDWEFNPDLGKKFFNNAITSYTENSTDVGPDFWAANRPITVNQEEATYIESRDSTRDYLKSPAYIRTADSSFNHTGFWDFVLFGVGKRNTSKGYTWTVNPLISQYSLVFPRFPSNI